METTRAEETRPQENTLRRDDGYSARHADARGGLIVAASAAATVWGLSFFGESAAAVTAAAAAAGFAAMLGGLAWAEPQRARGHAGRVLRQKQGIVLFCLLFVALIPLTHWPLRLSFLLAKPELERAALLGLSRMRERHAEGPASRCPWSASLPAPVEMKEHAAFLTVRRARVLPEGGLFLTLRRAPEGETGFLFVPRPETGYRHPVPDGVVALGGGWYFATAR